MKKSEVAYLAARRPPDMTAHTFIANTGASSHMGPSADGMINLSSSKTSVRFGVGANHPTTAVGGRKGEIVQLDGTKQNITLENYKQVPALWTNLFSLTHAIKNDWKLVGTKECLTKSKYSTTAVL